MFIYCLSLLQSLFLLRLVIESASVPETGVYTLTASNTLGETIETAKLTVHGRKY